MTGRFPNDADGGGAPANCVTLKLTVGDPSGSESERWTMEVVEDGGPYTPVARHCDLGFGAPDSAEYSLVKGKSYTFKLRWGATNYSSPDFDWRCWINDLASAGARPALYGTGAIVIEDPGGLMTNYTDGEPDNLTLGKEGKIHVPKVELDAEKTLLTLKHDRECGLDVNVAPESGFTVSGYRIETRRKGSAERHTLGESRTPPWRFTPSPPSTRRGIRKMPLPDFCCKARSGDAPPTCLPIT